MPAWTEFEINAELKYSFYIAQPPCIAMLFILGCLCEKKQHGIIVRTYTNKCKKKIEISSISKDCNKRH